MRPTSPLRKLHAGHFAFMRAVVQGLDTAAVWDRYLSTEGDRADARVVRSTITGIRHAFAAAAKRHGKPGTSRLVVMEPPPADDVAAPTLDDFAAEHGLADFSEQEQLDAWEAHYGSSARHTRRRGRLVDKQLRALHWLESVAAQPPRRSDGVRDWFPSELATMLARHDVFTLDQLFRAVDVGGFTWHRRFRGIGEIKAARIVTWLRAHADSLGIVVGAHVQVPSSQLPARARADLAPPATALRPIERFVIPQELDGTQGKLRAPGQHSTLEARNDYEATLAWIASKKRPEDPSKGPGRHFDDTSLTHTQRAYRREAERFMLWAVLERGKAMSSMTVEDCTAYRDFLSRPSPATTWCGPRGTPRWSPAWRPFEGPLAARSQATAVKILASLYRFLVEQGYLVANPWTGVAVARVARMVGGPGRALSVHQWHLLMDQLDTLPASSANQRLRLALRLLYATGLRLSEIVAATTDDLEHVVFDQTVTEPDLISEAWVLHVRGKGDVLREVLVPTDLVAELGHYLASRGLPADPLAAAAAGVHLLGAATDAVDRAPNLPRQVRDAKAGIQPGTLYEQLKRFFERVAQAVQAESPQDARRLAAASTHWLRHTHSSHSIAHGTPVQIQREALGHASLATTTMYLTVDRQRRLASMSKFWSSVS